MPVDFQYESLQINSFRGIPKLELKLPEGMPTYLIGANNSGKSTVLTALALVLRGGGLHRFTPSEYDFYINSEADRAETFSIKLTFTAGDETQLPAVQGVGDPEFVHGILVDGYETAGGQLEHRRRLIDASGDPITFSTRTPIAKDKKDKYEEQDVGYRPRNARLSDIREHMPEIWLLTPQNLERSLYEWKTGPLQQLSDLLTDRFLEEEWEIEYSGKHRPMPDTMYKVHEFFRDSVVEFPFWRDELRPKLEETLSSYIGRQAGMRLRPEVQELEQWLAQQLAASFSSDEGGAVTPLKRMGDGWQSLVRLAALDVLRGYSEEVDESVVLLYEEPETFLHAHLCRKLRSVLADLTETGWTVMAATHSPELITFRQSQKIVRLWRKGDEVLDGVVESDSIDEAPKLQELLNERGNHEFLFANRVIFCEGKGDAVGIRTYLEKSGCDLDGRSVTVLDVGGVSNIPSYADIASKLGIRWCAVTDEDRDEDTEEVKPVTKRAREDLGDLERDGDKSIIWPGSLESSLDLDERKASVEWIDSNIRPKEVEEIHTSYSDFADTCAEIDDWVRQEEE